MDRRPIRENQQVIKFFRVNEVVHTAGRPNGSTSPGSGLFPGRGWWTGGILASLVSEATMDPQQVLSTAQEALTVRRVFGDPIDVGGTTIVPVARVSGGGGGGGRGTQEGGVGYGLHARPVGVYAIRDGDVRWRPAIDVNRVILGGQLLAATAISVLGPVIARRWPARASAL